jgi:hypothetical protein
VGIRTWQNQVQTAVSVKATGNVHLRPTGHVFLVDEKGAQVADLVIPEGDPTYPGRVRGYAAKVPPDLKLAPGRYTAQADLHYGDLEMKAARDFTVSSDGQIQMKL